MKVQLSSAASNPLGCPDWVGMTVRLAPEWVSALDRNQCPECVGICKEITSISTYYVNRTKTDTFYLIGTGDFSMTEEGEVFTGISYLDAKGTWKKDKSGEVISTTVSGKIAGGCNNAFLFSGSFRSVLTKQGD